MILPGVCRFLFILSCLFAVIPTAEAFSWADLWQTPNQQGASLFSKGKSIEAAELFTAPEWKGSALYRGGQYEKAADAFRQSKTPLAYYNLGNTLAQMGDFNNAIAAYNQTLALDSTFADAKFNRDLLEKLMKENPSAQKDQSQNQQQKNSQEASQDNPSDQSKQNQQQAEQDQQQDRTKKQEQQQAQQQNQDQKAGKNQSADNPQKLTQDKKPDQSTSMAMAEQNTMQNQNEEQLLRRVPDEPGGLLRQKFLRDHERYEQKQYGG